MKPIPTDLYRAIRDSQLIGKSSYSKEATTTRKHERYIDTCVKV
ncbi:hypothetical protein glysoja_036145 [Glycine soja]|uniref:Uncharacterized protein n=1 Tax=Glycine soja TaxID=3848 RepID=A0A0B2SKT0_GLYSO|nr:hypothetical protein glysoja_036145 [Glycine soja]